MNLLPEQEKKIIQKEYALRRVVVWCGLVVGVLTISLILLVPSYVLSRLKASDVQSELDTSKRTLESQLLPADVTKAVASAAHDADALKPFADPLSAYNIIRIFETKPASIRIYQINFSNLGTDQAGAALKPSLEVYGKAVDRESLTSFGKSLEQRSEFASVDIPVSNFVRETNIDFTMTITLK